MWCLQDTFATGTFLWCRRTLYLRYVTRSHGVVHVRLTPVLRDCQQKIAPYWAPAPTHQGLFILFVCLPSKHCAGHRTQQLHAHLHGCIRPATISELAAAGGVDLTPEQQRVLAPGGERTLSDCFKIFDTIHT